MNMQIDPSTGLGGDKEDNAILIEWISSIHKYGVYLRERQETIKRGITVSVVVV